METVVLFGPELCANEAWFNLLFDIYMNGKESAPRGLRIRERLCNTTRVDMRFPVVSNPKRRMGFRFLAAEAWWILSGKNDVASIAPYSKHISNFSDDGLRFSGAYGPRIIDQLTFVVDSLHKDPDTRQAVVEVWRPNPRPSKDIPCTISAQFLMRDKKLHCIDTMRSSDAWLGWPYDTFNFSCLTTMILLMLRARSSDWRDIGLGTLFLTAGSSHLYENPAQDGAVGVPYVMHDVVQVLNSPTGPLRQTALNPDNFSDSAKFVEHLEAAKDRRIGRGEWLAEFLMEAK